MTEITTEDTTLQYFSLSYLVQHVDYNLTISTTLTPLNSETYNRSFTFVNYAPLGESKILSLELVEFNSPVTLSQLYTSLDKVAKTIGQAYTIEGETNDEATLVQLGQNYYKMSKEIKDLSKLVKEQLQEYDKEILNNSAILMDAGSVWNCIGCLGWIIVNAFLDPGCAVCIGCISAASIFWWLLIGCVPICMYCILGWALVVYDCCMCAEYMGWIDCPL